MAQSASHPVWVRGLKLYVRLLALGRVVAPRVGAWIETVSCPHCGKNISSHPVWVRGLKRTC